MKRITIALVTVLALASLAFAGAYLLKSSVNNSGAANQTFNVPADYYTQRLTIHQGTGVATKNGTFHVLYQYIGQTTWDNKTGAKGVRVNATTGPWQGNFTFPPNAIRIYPTKLNANQTWTYSWEGWVLK